MLTYREGEGEPTLHYEGGRDGGAHYDGGREGGPGQYDGGRDGEGGNHKHRRRLPYISSNMTKESNNDSNVRILSLTLKHTIYYLRH